MHRFFGRALVVFISTGAIAPTAYAQLPRRQNPAASDAPAAEGGIQRNSKFPYAGLWHGTRTMPIGTGDVSFRFTVVDDKYSGLMLFPDGGSAPQKNLTATAAGLTWESPNSGGGTWVYQVRLVGPDSMTGSLVLRDAPPNFNPVPRGTLVLTRQAPPGAGK